jgi:threonylcarbamoyladenosine tRNA methylthiotransferase CDKAL1
MNKNKVFIYDNACIRRKLDANKIYYYFLKNNYQIVDNPKEADYIIFITCAFVNKMVESDLSEIKKLKKYDAELIVAGCLPDIAKDKLKEIFDGKTISTKNLNEIDNIFKNNRFKFEDINDTNLLWHNYNPLGVSKEPYWIFQKLLSRFRFLNSAYNILKEKILKKSVFFHHIFRLSFLEKHYFIFISRGCTSNCTYCAIKKAIGPLKSKSVDECVRELKIGLNNGYRHIQLEADDAGAYGIDIGSSLPELLDKITELYEDFIIEVGEIHPAWIIRYAEKLEPIIKRGKIKYLLMAIQSGNNRILNLMKRTYDKESLIESLSKLKKAYPGLDIGIQAIIGFPSETMDEFKETLQFVDIIKPSEGILFPFSNVKGTEANNIKPIVSKREMKNRAKFALKFLKKRDYQAHHSVILKYVTFQRKE